MHFFSVIALSLFSVSVECEKHCGRMCLQQLSLDKSDLWAI